MQVACYLQFIYARISDDQERKPIWRIHDCRFCITDLIMKRSICPYNLFGRILEFRSRGSLFFQIPGDGITLEYCVRNIISVVCLLKDSPAQINNRMALNFDQASFTPESVHKFRGISPINSCKL